MVSTSAGSVRPPSRTSWAPSNCALVIRRTRGWTADASATDRLAAGARTRQLETVIALPRLDGRPTNVGLEAALAGAELLQPPSSRSGATRRTAPHEGASRSGGRRGSRRSVTRRVDQPRRAIARPVALDFGTVHRSCSARRVPERRRRCCPGEDRRPGLLALVAPSSSSILAGLLGVVESDHLAGYAIAATARRTWPPSLEPCRHAHAQYRRSASSNCATGRGGQVEMYVIVDDYDLCRVRSQPTHRVDRTAAPHACA